MGDKYDIKLEGRKSTVTLNGKPITLIRSASIHVNADSPMPVLKLEIYLTDYDVKVVPVPFEYTTDPPSPDTLEKD